MARVQVVNDRQTNSAIDDEEQAEHADRHSPCPFPRQWRIRQDARVAWCAVACQAHAVLQAKQPPIRYVDGNSRLRRCTDACSAAA